MKKGLSFLAYILLILGLALLGMGLYMLITLNSMALLKLTARMAYLYIILHKWFMLGGGVLLAAGAIIFLRFRRKRKVSQIV